MSLIGQSIGNYRITSVLGEGGMGTVYLGEHPLIGKKVAIKVLLGELAAKEDIVSRFFNEAKAVNDIGHSNIVDIVDFGKAGGQVYFIMEYLDGDSLSARLQRTGLQFHETLHVMAQCCSALAASHQKGIVHRDLKPENIYLCPRGGDRNFVKILDFGIAKLTGHGGSSSKTRTGLVIGTPAYMSPEQCEGKGQIDHRSDVYSLGVVMYELLTGTTPFNGEGFGEMLVSHLTRQPHKPSAINPHVTPELDSIVMHALEKDRNRRFQTMEEFGRAIADPLAHLRGFREPPTQQGRHSGSTQFLDDSTVRSPMPRGQTPTTLSGAASEVEGRRAPGRGRGGLWAAMAVAVLLAAGGIGFVALRPSAPAQQPPLVIPPPQPEPPRPEPPKPEVKNDVTIELRTDPPGAKAVKADGTVLGVTPFKMTLAQGSPSFDVQFRLDGYKLAHSLVRTELTSAIDVTLSRDATEVAPEPPQPQEPTPRVTPVTKKKPPKRAHTTSQGDPESLILPSFMKEGKDKK